MPIHDRRCSEKKFFNNKRNVSAGGSAVLACGELEDNLKSQPFPIPVMHCVQLAGVMKRPEAESSQAECKVKWSLCTY